MTDITALIQSLEEQRCQALIAGDLSALDRLFSEQLNWCHSSGKVDTKAALLERIASGSTKYLNMKRSDTRFIVGTGAAVSTGLVEMAAIVAGKEHQLSNRYATVWFEEGGAWRLVTWQSTRAPAD
jgi:hypothetical protein